MPLVMMPSTMRCSLTRASTTLLGLLASKPMLRYFVIITENSLRYPFMRVSNHFPKALPPNSITLEGEGKDVRDVSLEITGGEPMACVPRPAVCT